MDLSTYGFMDILDTLWIYRYMVIWVFYGFMDIWIFYGCKNLIDYG